MPREQVPSAKARSRLLTLCVLLTLVGPSGLEPPTFLASGLYLAVAFASPSDILAPYTLLSAPLSVLLSLDESTRSPSAIFTFAKSSTSLVGPSGLEPPTSCLSGTRSNLLSYEPMWLVSDSITWTQIMHYAFCILHCALRALVEMMGFDSRANYALSHSRLWPSTGRPFTTTPTSNPAFASAELKYPYSSLVEMMGFEPMTPCLQGRCSPSWATPPFKMVCSILRFSVIWVDCSTPRLCQHWAIFPYSLP